MKKIHLILTLTAALTWSTETLRADDGKTIYEAQCAKCHGKDAAGETAMGKKVGCKDYTQAKNWEGIVDSKLVQVLKEGMKNGDKVLMKPFELSDADAQKVITYMRSLQK